MFNEFDKGPTKRMARVFSAMPDHSAHADLFWYNWGPIFYRGRLNKKKVKLLVVASDPGPTERLIGRSLIGDAGQRVQGFLTKVGLTKSYLCLNAHPYSLHPSKFSAGKRLLDDEPFVKWRERLFNKTVGPNLEAIVAFGSQAQKAVDLWASKPAVPLYNIPHPSSRDPEKLAREWGEAVTDIRTFITPDDPAGLALPNYGVEHTHADYASIPRRDLPFGTPHFIGDDPPKGTSDFRQSTVKRSGDDIINWNITGR